MGKGPGVGGSGGERGWGELGERGVGEPMEVRKQNYKGKHRQERENKRMKPKQHMFGNWTRGEKMEQGIEAQKTEEKEQIWKDEEGQANEFMWGLLRLRCK